MTDAHKAIVRRAFQTNPLLGSPTAAKDRDLYANDFVFTGPSTELASIDAFSTSRSSQRSPRRKRPRLRALGG